MINPRQVRGRSEGMSRHDRIKVDGDKCPLCGQGVYIKKAQMACEVLEMIKYPIKKSVYSDGTFNRFEMQAIYNFIKDKV